MEEALGSLSKLKVNQHTDLLTYGSFLIYKLTSLQLMVNKVLRCMNNALLPVFLHWQHAYLGHMIVLLPWLQGAEGVWCTAVPTDGQSTRWPGHPRALAGYLDWAVEERRGTRSPYTTINHETVFFSMWVLCDTHDLDCICSLMRVCLWMELRRLSTILR